MTLGDVNYCGVDLDDIDPIYWNSTYYLGPAEDVGAEKPYALLLKAMKEKDTVAMDPEKKEEENRASGLSGRNSHSTSIKIP